MLLAVFAACGSNNGESPTEGSNTENAASPGNASDGASTQDNSSSSGGGGVQRSVINTTVSFDVASLTPFSFVSSKQICNLIYQSLGQIDAVTGELQGILLKDYSYSDDGLTMHCEIYDNIFDSEGNHITAEDVVWSYEMAEENGAISLDRDCSGAVVTGDYTFDFNLTHKMMIGKLDKFTKWYVVSKAAYEASADNMHTTPVGTGPYKLDEFNAGYAFTLVKNDNYWDKGNAANPIAGQNVDKIVFYVISESAQRTIALENGSIDACQDISQLDLSKFIGNDNFQIYTYRSSMSIALYPNCDTSSVVNDVNLRKALFYAINSEAVVKGVTNGEGAVNHSVNPDWSVGYNPEWANQDSYYNVYDIDLAKDYLAKSNYSDETLNIICNNEEELTNAAQLVSSFLTQIGVNNKIVALEQSTYKEYLKDPSEWDLAIDWMNTNTYWIDGTSGELGTQKTSWGSSMNFIYDDKLQDMMNNAMIEENATPENLNEINDYINENAYIYSICNKEPDGSVLPSFISEICAFNGSVYYGGCTYTEQ